MKNDIEMLKNGWASILPPNVAFDLRKSENFTGQLDSSELAVVRNACQDRKNEFSTGRYILKSLLNVSNISYESLISLQNRSVRLPQSTVGSITHCDGIVLAALGSKDDYEALGCDMELIDGVEYRDLCSFLPLNEREEMEAVSGEKKQLRLAVAFSLRESLFKALNPLFGRWFDFSDIELTYYNSEKALIVPKTDFILEKLCYNYKGRFFYEYTFCGRFVLSCFYVSSK